MQGHCSTHSQISMGPEWVLHSIVGWEVLGCLKFANFCPVELLDSCSFNSSGSDIFWILESSWSFMSLAQSTIPISGQLVTSAGAKSSSVKTFLLYGCILETQKPF